MWSLYSSNFQSSSSDVIKAFSTFLDSFPGWLSDKEFQKCTSIVNKLGGQCKPDWQREFLMHHIPAADLRRLSVLEKQTTEPELLAMIRARREEIERDMTIVGTMKSVVERSGWSPDMVSYLMEQPVEDYCQEILASDEDKLLRCLVSFGQSWRSAGDGERKVVQKLVEALEIVAKESDLHRMRAQWIIDKLRPHNSSSAPPPD
jgi:hypothetical protein